MEIQRWWDRRKQGVSKPLTASPPPKLSVCHSHRSPGSVLWHRSWRLEGKSRRGPRIGPTWNVPLAVHCWSWWGRAALGLSSLGGIGELLLAPEQLRLGRWGPSEKLS